MLCQFHLLPALRKGEIDKVRAYLTLHSFLNLWRWHGKGGGGLGQEERLIQGGLRVLQVGLRP